DIPGMNPAKFDMEELRKHSLNQELLTGSGLGDENMNEDEEEGEYADDTAEVTLEALKIGRYIMENLKLASDKEHISEKLLVMFTYNAERGIFRKDLADPMMDRFQEFDQAIKRIRIVAEIENNCKFPTSAWAYPKPKAAQILCKDRNYHCPYIVNGWDLRIITPQDPFGYIGTSLETGTYPKCALEEELHARIKISD
ncbi:hypothetical protein P3G55_18320, partial [Leptospira sp. 96542]|nr:hypothetical protein [Leptospira sp. 96542]